MTPTLVQRVRDTFTPPVRRWSYGVGAALATALGVFGILDGQQILAVNLVLAALFGMAVRNTTTS